MRIQLSAVLTSRASTTLIPRDRYCPLTERSRSQNPTESTKSGTVEYSSLDRPSQQTHRLTLLSRNHQIVTHGCNRTPQQRFSIVQHM